MAFQNVPALPGITLQARPFSRGPLAVLYRGWDRVHRCDVVVKVQRLTDDPVAVNRFGREAAVMLRARHPSIVTLFAVQEGDPRKGIPSALIMEYVPGQTLAALVASQGRLSLAQSARIIEEIASALDCVHALGVVHRDVKPSNILLPPHGPAKLTDFGVARIDNDAPLTVMGDVLGTIEYASPEQVHGNAAVDTRSDVYSLAAVAYFLLAGTPPFRAADNTTQAQLSVMHRQVFAEPPPLTEHRPDLTPAIQDAVLRGLAKAPESRYASAGQFAAALRSAVSAASGEPQQEAMAVSSRRTGLLAGALASGLLLLAGFALWNSGGLTRPSPAAHTPLPAPVLKPSLPVRVLPIPAPKSAALPPARKSVQVALAPEAPVHRQRRLAARKPPFVAAPVHQQRFIAASPHPAAAHKLLPKHGWLMVYARQNIAPFGQPNKLAGVPAQTITVDGRTFPALTTGHWVSIPAGRHRVSFYPVTQSGFGARAGIPIFVAPGAYVKRQVPLAVASAPKTASAPHVGWYSVSGWVAAPAARQKPLLVKAAPLWIKVDGRPFLTLALGQWAALPAGKHLIAFQPAAGLGAGSKTWAIDLSPRTHLSQQIPLPAVPLPDIPPHLRNP